MQKFEVTGLGPKAKVEQVFADGFVIEHGTLAFWVWVKESRWWRKGSQEIVLAFGTGQWHSVVPVHDEVDL